MTRDHGHSQVVCDGNIVRVILKGAFNREGAERYEMQARAAIESLDGKPFLMLVDDTEVEGGTPDAYAALDRFNQWQSTLPLIAKAFIVQQSLLEQILLRRTPSLKAQNTAFFNNTEQALQWLYSEEEKYGR